MNFHPDNPIVRFFDALRNTGKATCPVCQKVSRESAKSYNRFMAADLERLVFWDNQRPGVPVHGNTFFKADPDGNRGHDIATQRFWGLIEAVDRPADALPSQKGSKGLSGFYILTQKGRDFYAGRIRIQRNVVRKAVYADDDRDYEPSGDTWITFGEARDQILKTGEQEIIVDGTAI